MSPRSSRGATGTVARQGPLGRRVRRRRVLGSPRRPSLLRSRCARQPDSVREPARPLRAGRATSRISTEASSSASSSRASPSSSRARRSGDVCAIAATCCHLGGPLDDGARDGDTVVCPWHGSRFDLCTGEVQGGPAVYRAGACADDGRRARAPAEASVGHASRERTDRFGRRVGSSYRDVSRSDMLRGPAEAAATIERWPRRRRRPTSPT